MSRQPGRLLCLPAFRCKTLLLFGGLTSGPFGGSSRCFSISDGGSPRDVLCCRLDQLFSGASLSGRNSCLVLGGDPRCLFGLPAPSLFGSTTFRFCGGLLCVGHRGLECDEPLCNDPRLFFGQLSRLVRFSGQLSGLRRVAPRSSGLLFGREPSLALLLTGFGESEFFLSNGVHEFALLVDFRRGFERVLLCSTAGCLFGRQLRTDQRHPLFGFQTSLFLGLGLTAGLDGGEFPFDACGFSGFLGCDASLLLGGEFERGQTSFFLSCLLISAVVNSPSVPTISRRKLAGSVMR